MNKNGRTLSEDIKLIRHGMTEFGTFLPGQLKLLFIHSLITMTIPYIPGKYSEMWNAQAQHYIND